MCWDRTASAREVLELADLVRRGQIGASRLLGDVGDPGAAPVLRQLLRDDDEDVRAAAARSLGWSGDLEDVPGLLGLLDDPSHLVQEQVVGSLAELGGAEALDALWAVVERGHPSSRWAVEGLASRRDPRVLPLLRARFQDGSNYVVRSLLLAYGDPADLATRKEQILREARARPGQPAAAAHAWHELAALHPPERRQETFDRFRAWTADHLPGCLDLLDHYDPSRVEERLAEPAGPTRERESSGGGQVLQWTDEAPTDPGVAVARFGGQPEWAGPATWPLSDTGVPMVFYGQLPLPDRRTAFVFVVPDGDSFEPLAGQNACVVQPGAPPDTAWTPRETGPQRYDAVHEPRPGCGRLRLRWLPARPRSAVLAPAPAPGSGTARSREEARWNHVGGLPTWLQGPEQVPGDGWRFAFQFSAGAAGMELGDGAECYGFVTDDGRGAFLWQCH